MPTSRLKLGLVLGGALLPAAVLAACSTPASRTVLTFFFDGVPDPSQTTAGPRPEAARRYTPEEMAAMTNEQRAALLKVQVPKMEVSTHPPVEANLCEECHDQQPSQPGSGGLGGWSGAVPTLILPEDRLCLKCHQRPGGRFTHGPAAQGSCGICHLPHRSPQPHLLRVPRMADLCTKCHAGELFVTSGRHAVVQDRDCHSCHDPHASERANLLKPGAPALPEASGPGLPDEG